MHISMRISKHISMHIASRGTANQRPTIFIVSYALKNHEFQIKNK